MKIPDGYMGMITPRSGLAMSRGFTIVNSPGIIDSDYRGEISVLGALMSHELTPMELSHGTRFAQIIFVPIPEINIKEGVVPNDTDRGDRGFGYTGRH